MFSACNHASSTPSALALYLIVFCCALIVGLFIAYVVAGMLDKPVPSDRTCLAVLAGVASFGAVGTFYLYAMSASGAINWTVCLPQRLSAAAFTLVAAGVLVGGMLLWMLAQRRRAARSTI